VVFTGAHGATITAVWKRLIGSGAAVLALALVGPAKTGHSVTYAQQPAPRPGSGQAARPVIDVQALGPQVGARIPEFTLVDQTGVRRTLRSLMGPKGLMLVLFRSADW
jgi:hypothetical protein